MTAPSIEEWVEGGRRAQGLSPRITDEATLLRVAGMVAAARLQNDRDHEAGLLPARHVEDPSVLEEVATLITD